MPIDTSNNTITTANAVIYKVENGQIYFLLVQEHDGAWGLAGGAKEIEDPDLRTTLQRELQEELGLKSSDYEAVNPNVRREFEYDHFKSSRFGKHGVTVFFLVVLPGQTKVTQSPELAAIGWFSKEEAEERLTFDHIRNGFKEASAAVTFLHQQLSRIGDPSICPSAFIVKDGKVLKGLRHYTPDKWKEISVWISPGGRCEPGETIENAVRREVREEVGIKDLNILYFLGEVPGAKEGDIVPLFFCGTTEEPVLMEPEKFSEWKWIPFAEYLQGEPWSTMSPTAHRLTSEFLNNQQTNSVLSFIPLSPEHKDLLTSWISEDTEGQKRTGYLKEPEKLFALLNSKKRWMWVVYEGKTPVGFFDLEKLNEKDGAFLFYIALDCREKGYGRKLIAAAQGLFQAKELKRLLAYVEEDNQASIQTLLSQGFIALGKDKDGLLEFQKEL